MEPLVSKADRVMELLIQFQICETPPLGIIVLHLMAPLWPISEFSYIYYPSN
jgi:hypothetical protein